MALERTATGWKARWREPNGKQRAKTFRTKRDANDHLAKVNADKLRGEYSTRTASPPLRDVADEWLDAAVNLSPVTLATYRRDFDTYLDPEFGSIRADRIDARTIQRWLTAELKRLKPVTVHRHYRTMRTLMGFAQRMGYIPRNPCDNVTPPKVGRTDVHILTVDQVNAIADALPARYRAMVLVSAYGGLRWGEVVGLRRCDIDGAKVTVAGQLQRIDDEWQRLEPKWASRRTVVLPASIALELAAHLDEFTGAGGDDLVFTNERGAPVGGSFRGNVWGPACVRAGLATEEWVRSSERSERGRYEYRRKVSGAPRFHDLRHTAASLAIATGAHPKTIQARLGHSTIAMTMDLYGHLMDGMDAQLAADLDALRGST